MVVSLNEIVGVLWTGLIVTIQLSVVTLVVGSFVGLCLGTVRALGLPILGRGICLFVHLVRGTPFLVQLFIVYFVLPQTGLTAFQMSPYVAGVLALSIYASAYATEIVRAGLLSVPQSQIDAGKALGLTLFQRLCLVVFPQALRLMLPQAGGLYVVVVKSTSILSVVGITELVRTGEILALRMPQNLPLIYLCVAGLYFAFCFPLLSFVLVLEHRLAAGGKDI